MLKSAMQSQLDGVRVGLNQLQAALRDIEEIKQKCVASSKTYTHLGACLFCGTSKSLNKHYKCSHCW
jgi:hypothetical protein